MCFNGNEQLHIRWIEKMNERRKQMANEETGKAIPYEQWKKEQAAYQTKMERYNSNSQGSGDLNLSESDELSLDRAWEIIAEQDKKK